MNKPQITITIPANCLEWIDQQVTSRTYATRSHAIEVLILDAMKGEGEKNNVIQKH